MLFPEIAESSGTGNSDLRGLSGGPFDYQPPGLGFEPNLECLYKHSKGNKCNPFRSKHRKYFESSLFGPSPRKLLKLPMIEEVIILRRIPIFLGRLLVALDQSKIPKQKKYLNKEEKQPIQTLPVLSPNENPNNIKSYEDIMPKDQSYDQVKGQEYKKQDAMKAKQEQLEEEQEIKTVKEDLQDKNKQQQQQFGVLKEYIVKPREEKAGEVERIIGVEPTKASETRDLLLIGEKNNKENEREREEELNVNKIYKNKE